MIAIVWASKSIGVAQNKNLRKPRCNRNSSRVDSKSFLLSLPLITLSRYNMYYIIDYISVQDVHCPYKDSTKSVSLTELEEELSSDLEGATPPELVNSCFYR